MDMNNIKMLWNEMKSINSNAWIILRVTGDET
jgi:hypothetical protein